MTADQLREALDEYTPNPDESFADPTTMEQAKALTRYNQQRSLIRDAARSWLTLLEGDEAIVEKVRSVLVDQFMRTSGDLPKGWFDETTRRLLAAVVGEDL